MIMTATIMTRLMPVFTMISSHFKLVYDEKDKSGKTDDFWKSRKQENRKMDDNTTEIKESNA